MSRIMSFLIGGLVGAGVALAFAPQSGEKTRALVTERANSLAGEAKDFANSMPDTLQGAYRQVVDQGTNIVNATAAKMKEVTGTAADNDADELREKIEAARQRIASQVMENAEQSKAVAAEATDAAVQAVEDAGQKVQDTADQVAEAAKEQTKKN